MKSKQIIKQFGHLRLSEVPSDILTLIESDPVSLEWFKKADLQRDLLQLKHHERPSPEIQSRIAYHVRTRIEAGDSLPVPELATPKSAFILPLTAAAAIAIIGTVAYLNQPPGIDQPSVAQDIPQATGQALSPALSGTDNTENENLTPVEAMFTPIPTATDVAANTNTFPKLAPGNQPGGSRTFRVSGPPSSR